MHRGAIEAPSIGRTFRVQLTLRNGTDTDIVKSLRDPGMALDIEAAIEEHLGLAATPVHGEIGETPSRH